MSKKKKPTTLQVVKLVIDAVLAIVEDIFDRFNRDSRLHTAEDRNPFALCGGGRDVGVV